MLLYARIARNLSLFCVYVYIYRVLLIFDAFASEHSNV